MSLGKVEAAPFWRRVSRREKAAIDAARSVRTRAGLGIDFNVDVRPSHGKVQGSIPLCVHQTVINIGYFFQSTKRRALPRAPRLRVVSRCGAKSSGLNSKSQNRNDGTKHGPDRKSSSRHVNRTVGSQVCPPSGHAKGHISLLKRLPAEGNALGLDPMVDTPETDGAVYVTGLDDFRPGRALCHRCGLASWNLSRNDFAPHS